MKINRKSSVSFKGNGRLSKWTVEIVFEKKFTVIKFRWLLVLLGQYRQKKLKTKIVIFNQKEF